MHEKIAQHMGPTESNQPTVGWVGRARNTATDVPSVSLGAGTGWVCFKEITPELGYSL